MSRLRRFTIYAFVARVSVYVRNEKVTRKTHNSAIDKWWVGNLKLGRKKWNIVRKVDYRVSIVCHVLIENLRHVWEMLCFQLEHLGLGCSGDVHLRRYRVDSALVELFLIFRGHELGLIVVFNLKVKFNFNVEKLTLLLV